VASFDQIKEPLERALACARQIADNCTQAFNRLDSFKSEMKSLRRDLPLLMGRVQWAFRGDKLLKAALKRELKYLRTDAFRAARWIALTVKESDELQKALGTGDDVSQRLAAAGHQAFLEGHKRREALNATCDRATARITEICADADKAAEGPAAVQEPTPLAPAPVDNAPVFRDELTEARDKWIYEQCCKGVPYDSIARNLTKQNPRWNSIESKQGILAAARRYAKRRRLPPPHRRQEQ
jgi:hypothetical protein